MLYEGDGTRRTEGIGDIITVAAGRPGSIGGIVGDGIPATNARLSYPTGVAVAPDGTLYVVDYDGSEVRRVTPDGIITRFAGRGPLSQGGCMNNGVCGDGGPATLAVLSDARGIALGPDGSLYIADSLDNRIRRVGPDGIITTVVGTGVAGNSGDGGPATQAMTYRPQGIVVAPDGSIYFSSIFSYGIVRRVGPDGMITTVAGTSCPTHCANGDGGPAAKAILSRPLGLALGPDGSLYIADPGAERVRRIGPDGIISTVAGSGSPFPNICTGGPCGDGGPATQAALGDPKDVAVGADGTLYIADGDQDNIGYTSGYTRRVRAVTPGGTIYSVAGTGSLGISISGQPATSSRLMNPSYLALSPGALYIVDYAAKCVYRVASGFPDATLGTNVVTSADGSELYTFDALGRHLRTVDALTGALRYSFGYDAAGYLATITDGDGNITTIQHDAAGNPTAIVAPFGQRTTLTVDANGNLQSIVDPLGHTTTLTSTADGLLTGFSDPNHNLHQFTYDSEGRLVTDADPAGGLKTLGRVDGTDGYTVTVATKLDATRTYTSTYVTRVGVDGTLTHTDIGPDGLTTTTTQKTDGSITTTSPDGTTETVQQGPDPRFGMQAPVPVSDRHTTPGGLTTTLTATRTVALTDSANLLSLQAMTETLALNGRTSTSVYNGATRTMTDTTAAGRQTITTLDAHGRAIRVTMPGLLPLGLTYDTHGRLTTVTQGTRSTSWSYDAQGNVASASDPLSQTTRFGYDAADRPITQTLADGNIITSAYDANGNLTALTPPGDPAHRFTYTALDQMQSYTPPDTGTGSTATGYTYSADRQPTSVTQPDGSQITLAYDSAGRLQGVTIPRGATTYGYDSASRLSTVTAPDGGATTYGYDGDLPTTVGITGSVTGTVGYAYNADLRVGSESVAGAGTVSYQYDADGLPTGIGSLSRTYDPQNGLPISSTIGAITDTLGYNGFGEETAYTATNGSSALLTDAYARDDLGRITALTETIAGATDTYGYSYDAVGRLTAVTKDGALQTTYGYDANGNRTTEITPGGTTTATYDAQDRLQQYGTTAYSYTASGMLQAATDTTTGNTTGYGYDALDNLMAVTLTNGTRIGYVIDGNGQRIGKKVNGTLVQGFLYGAEAGPVAELDGQGNVVSRFVYGTSDNVPDYMVKGGVTYRIITDHLGSPRLVVNTSTGTVTQEMDYDTFGRVLNDTNPGFQPFGFAGGLYDRDTGLMHFGARDYDSAIGRWVTRDPVGFEGGDTNVYTYVLDDPVNNVDWTGLDAQSPEKKPEESTWEKLMIWWKVKQAADYCSASDDNRLKTLKKFDRQPGDTMKEYKKLIDEDKKIKDEGLDPFGKTVINLWKKAGNALSGEDSPDEDSQSPQPSPSSKPKGPQHWIDK